jgi:hypothetical protein
VNKAHSSGTHCCWQLSSRQCCLGRGGLARLVPLESNGLALRSFSLLRLHDEHSGVFEIHSTNVQLNNGPRFTPVDERENAPLLSR